MRDKSTRVSALCLAGLVWLLPGCSSQTTVAITVGAKNDAGSPADSPVPPGGTPDSLPAAEDLAPGPKADATADGKPPAADASAEAAPDSRPKSADAGLEASPEAASVDAASADAIPADAMPADAADARPRAEAGAGLPFEDNFSNGYSAWQLSSSDDGPVTVGSSGAIAFVTLDASSKDFSRLRTNFDGTAFIEPNLSAQMSYRVVQAPSSTRTIRLDVRQGADTENVFYAVGATVTSDGQITKVSIFKKVPDTGDNYTICSLAEGKLANPVDASQWQSFKLTISGTSKVTLAAYFKPTATATAWVLTATASDDCKSALTSTSGVTVPNGGCLADQTGLGIQVEHGLTASVDDVLVTSP